MQEAVAVEEGVRYTLRNVSERFKCHLSGCHVSRVLASVVLTECRVCTPPVAPDALCMHVHVN